MNSLVENITKKTAEYYNINYQDIFLNGRSKKDVAIAKEMAWYIIKENLTETTFKGLGMYFNRHHATIIYGIQTIKAEIEVCKKREKQYQEIKKILSYD